MASEAQRIMTVSLKKIVESRSRRGGVSLHRNLLIAGVLFKARDVMLAEQSKPVEAPRPVVVDPQPTENYCQPMDDDDSCVVPDSTAEVPMDCADVELSPSPSPVDSKENIPPPNSSSSVDVAATRGLKRQSVDDQEVSCDSCPPTKSAKLDNADHCVPELPSVTSTTDGDCKSTSKKSKCEVSQSRVSRTVGSSTTSRLQLKRTSSTKPVIYQPVLCLPRLEFKSTSAWNSMERPILVVQVV
jgi:hypothetical protein